ncbi:MAG: DMT family transporter [Alphaproteobacteria bacterium]|nr:DMT family transporter [Alphaproteobacteria bacterium]
MRFGVRLGPVAAGIACGTGAAVFWAAGFTAARHGIDIGFSPFDLTLHRCIWAGLALLPLLLRDGAADLGGIGWARGVALTVLGGPGIAMLSYSGFILVPLGHGAVIQPSCAALFGILLAWLMLHERLPLSRVLGVATIVAGLLVIGGEAMTTIGASGVMGDLIFVLAGGFFAMFGTLNRLWRIDPMRATVVVSVVSLAIIPLHGAFAGYERMIALGLWENLLQAAIQGILAGPGAIWLFVRSVVLLGAARAAVFPSLVPGFTLLVGWIALGEVPTLAQVAGFAVVLVGFRLAQRG